MYHAERGLAPFRIIRTLLGGKDRKEYLEYKGLRGNAGKCQGIERNDRERKGILIGPLVAPCFSRPPRIPPSCINARRNAATAFRPPGKRVYRRQWSAEQCVSADREQATC